MSSVVSRWHMLALLALASCTDTGSHHDENPSPDAGMRDASVGTVADDMRGTGGTSGSNANDLHGIECFGRASYSVLNERGDEIRVQATLQSSLGGGRIDKTIAAGQMMDLYSWMAVWSGHGCTIPVHALSSILRSLRITAGGKVIYEGVKPADWTSGRLVIAPPDTDDAGVDEDAGR
jgi:hypothetical protein